MKTKFRLLACVMAVVCCMTAFSVTAFASGGDYYESNEDGGNTPPSSIDSITVSTEGVKLPENQGSEALTPGGNLSLIDDILQDESYYVSDEKVVKDKQFITIQSKNGNYFYIVIDRSGDSENVYFLNLVDEADLMALMEDGGDNTAACNCADKCVAGDVNTACPVCKNNMSECAGKEAAATTPEPDATSEPDDKADNDTAQKKSGNNSGLLLIVLLLAVAGGGAVYWFKFRKKKPDAKGPVDLDDYDYGEDDDEEYEIEDDAEPEETDAEDSDA